MYAGDLLCMLRWALIALIFGVCMSSVLLTSSNHKYTCLFTVLHYVVIIIGLATCFGVSSGLPWWSLLCMYLICGWQVSPCTEIEMISLNCSLSLSTSSLICVCHHFEQIYLCVFIGSFSSSSGYRWLIHIAFLTCFSLVCKASELKYFEHIQDKNVSAQEPSMVSAGTTISKNNYVGVCTHSIFASHTYTRSAI